MTGDKILLRLFVETGDVAEARRVADAVRSRVQEYSEAHLRKIEPYWKIPTYYEVTVDLLPPGNAKPALTGIMSQLGSGWDYHDLNESPGSASWAVWTPHPGSSFFSPKIRWANLELIQQTSER